MKILVTILFSVFLLNQCLELDSSKVVLAIDCGSHSKQKSQNGFVYQQDQYFSESKVADYSMDSERNGVNIKYTDDEVVYFTERHQDYSFHYNLPIKYDGTYVLILSFTELYFDHSQKRQFNIKIGDRVVTKNLDIVREVGKNAAYDHYIEFSLQNGMAFYQGQQCQQGYDVNKNTLKVEFEKIEGKDNPKVDGIIVVKGGLSDTDYYRVKQNRQNWLQNQQIKMQKIEEQKVKREAEKMKKKEKQRLRYDIDDEDEEFEELVEEQGFNWNVIETETIFTFVFVALAIIIVIYNMSTINSINLDIRKTKKRR